MDKIYVIERIDHEHGNAGQFGEYQQTSIETVYFAETEEEANEMCIRLKKNTPSYEIESDEFNYPLFQYKELTKY